MRLLIAGGGGLLATAVSREASARRHDVEELGRDALDVTSGEEVARALDERRPDLVVNCAAYTAVDRAEVEPEHARAVNRDGVRNLAQGTRRRGIRLVHLSTDYVFDGARHTPYRPADRTNPLSVYGRTKLEGEEVVAEEDPEALVVRTSWLYGEESGFVPAILKRARAGEPLRIVSDQRGRPSWAPDVAATLLDLVGHGARGIYHVAGGGDCTWLGLAREALALSGIEADVTEITSADLGAPAPRPPYSVLDLEKTEALLDREMLHWKDALRRYLAERVRGGAGVGHGEG